MALNFPSSPSLNDTHEENQTKWKWNGSSWTRIVTTGEAGAQGYQGATGPTGPAGTSGITVTGFSSTSKIDYTETITLTFCLS